MALRNPFRVRSPIPVFRVGNNDTASPDNPDYGEAGCKGP